MSPLILILGPTASGKTAAAIGLAKKINGEVVSADSRQVYAGFNIGTAKPKEAHRSDVHAITQADMVEGIPHYLLNVSSPTSVYSLAQWQHDAYTVIGDIIARGKQPIVVGGTMLYLDSIIYNYTIPQVPPNEALRRELETKDAEGLYRELLAKDPAAKDFIEPGNARRIIRALEVMAATGQPFSLLRKKHAPKYQLNVCGLFPGWDVLRKNIEIRAKQMIEKGFSEEVQQLQQRYSPALPLLQTMNYREVGMLLNGQLSKTGTIEKMVQANMRYAHRQMSWWKNRSEIQWLTQPILDEMIKAAEQ